MTGWRTPCPTGLLVERRYRRKDGTSLPAEVAFSQLPDGRLQRVIRDISARLAAEAERTRLISAVEQTGDAIWMSDADGVITYVNPAFTRAYGYAPGEVVGQHGAMLDSGKHEPGVLRCHLGCRARRAGSGPAPSSTGARAAG